MAQCICGRPYYPESTGEGPCHSECENCGCTIDDGNLCFDCHEEEVAKHAPYKQLVEIKNFLEVICLPNLIR